MVIGLGIAYPRFVHSSNLFAVLLTASPYLLASIGSAYLLIGGNVDLSIGAQWALDGMVVAYVAQVTQSPAAAIFTGLGLGVVLGAINGLLVRSLPISPLIVTLGMTLVYGGFSYVVSQGNPIEGLPNAFIVLGQGRVGGIGWPVIISLIVFLLGSLYLLVSVTGLRVFALGGNSEAARSAGIRTGRLTVAIFTWNGVVVSMVAILQTAQLAEGAAQVGVNFALVVLTAVILGGVSFLGGIGRPAGVFLGVLTLEVLNAGLIFIGVDDWWQQIAAGSVLVFALTGDEILRRRKVRTGKSLNFRLLTERFRRDENAEMSVQRPADFLVETEPALRVAGPSRKPGAVMLAVRGVSRNYGQVRAVEDISFEVHEGEVLCLVGDNGAGKSTVVKMIAGLVTPSGGSIEFEGRPLPTGDPRAVRELGIETVYQDLALCGNLSVMHNLVLGMEPTASGFLGLLRFRNDRAAAQRARERLGFVGVDLPDLRAVVRSLSGGQRQAVALARAVAEDTKILVLDEPTAALAVTQTERVLALVRRVAQSGKGIILISHDIRDVLAVADTVVVCRHGRVAYNGPASMLSESELVHLIAGIEYRGGEPTSTANQVRKGSVISPGG
jgi:ribose/xylose/arabinose/galactoside ABC-type transport system permease subunit/ABC-type branched-subunit amino acid transport system ATPase component